MAGDLRLSIAIGIPILAAVGSMVVSLVQISGIREELRNSFRDLREEMRELRAEFRELRTEFRLLNGFNR